MILWLNPFTGLSGDMFLAALLDVGASADGVREAVASTGLTGWELHVNRVDAGGIVATRAEVTVEDGATSRRASDLLELIRRARPAPVAALAARALGAIAEVEGRLHGECPALVHLHEIGGLDTVVDTVGVAAGLHLLGVKEVRCAPLPLGLGEVVTRHGLLPAPAPATLALLTGARITGSTVAAETVTPTGAALLRAAGATYGPPPEMMVQACGYGAGARRFDDRPNVLVALLGDPAPAPGAATIGTDEPMVVLATNVDDVTAEVLAHVMAAALEAGACDAWISPVVMKKGRPGHVLHLLCPPARVRQLQELALAETGSLGIRAHAVRRLSLPRTTGTVEVAGHAIRVKFGPWGAKPEHDDLVAAAHDLGLPLREVAAAAVQACRGQDARGGEPDPGVRGRSHGTSVGETGAEP